MKSSTKLYGHPLPADVRAVRQSVQRVTQLGITAARERIAAACFVSPTSLIAWETGKNPMPWVLWQWMLVRCNVHPTLVLRARADPIPQVQPGDDAAYRKPSGRPWGAKDSIPRKVKRRRKLKRPLIIAEHPPKPPAPPKPARPDPEPVTYDLPEPAPEIV
jgi:hypothetical protein